MDILFLTTVLPSKERTGGEIASQVFVNTLLELGHKVTVMGYHRKDDMDYKIAKHEYCIGQRLIETESAGINIVKWLVRAFAYKLPYSAAKYYSQNYLNSVRYFLNTNTSDLVIVEHSQLGWLLPILPANFIFIAHNVEYELYAQLAQQGRSVKNWLLRREARLMRILEAKLAQKAKQIWSLTKHDRDYFNKYNQHTTTFSIPSKILPCITSAAKSYDVGLIGTWTWHANFLGLQWFLKEVYPLLPLHISIHIAGKGAERLGSLPNNVIYQGFVPDAMVFMKQARIIAIPSVSGGGIQIKTLDALAAGSAIVATTLALRGIEDYPPELAVADTPREFAMKLVELLEQPQPKESFNHWTLQRQQLFKQTFQQTLGVIL